MAKDFFTTEELDRIESRIPKQQPASDGTFTTEQLDQLDTDFRIQTNDIKPSEVTTWRQPQTQVEALPPETETRIVSGILARKEGDLSEKPENPELPKEVADYYVSSLQDPNIPLEEIAFNMRRMSQERGVPLYKEPFDIKAAEQYRADAVAGLDVSDQVGYENWSRAIAPQLPRTDVIDPTANDLEAQLEEGMASVGGLNNWFKDWTDAEIQGVGGKEEIAKLFPDASEEDLEMLHEQLIGESRKAEMRQAKYDVDERDVNPVGRFALNTVGSLTAADALPFGAAKTAIGRVIASMGANVAYDYAVQASDLAYGGQDNYEGKQTVIAALGGAGFQGVIELGIKGFKRVAGRGVNDKGSFIDVETPDGEFKRVYRGEEDAPETITPEEVSPEGTPFEGGEIPSFLKNPVKQKGYDGKVKSKSKPDERVVGQRNEDVEARKNELTEGWQNAPEFLIVNNVDELDDKLAAELTADNAEGALGVTLPDGRVLLMTDNIKDPAQVDAVIFHEALGHVGLNSEFREGLDTLLLQMDEGNKNLRADVDVWIEKNPGAYEGNRARAVEEVLAEASEQGAFGDPGMMERLKVWLTQMARKAGLRKGVFTDAEVSAVLRQAHERIINGEKNQSAIPGMRFIRTWHASRADFDEFDDNYLMSGEGAMAYGAGHYTAQNEGVRSSYVDKFSDEEQMHLDGTNTPGKPANVYEVELPDEDWLDFDAPMSEQPETVQKAFEALENEFPDKGIWTKAETKKWEKEVAEAEVELREIQNDIDELELRYAETPEEDVPSRDMLEDDIEELYQYKSEAIEEANVAAYKVQSAKDYRKPDLEGQQMYYQAARDYFDGDEKALSKYLNSKGVPGNYFLDQPSRHLFDIEEQIEKINRDYEIMEDNFRFQVQNAQSMVDLLGPKKLFDKPGNAKRKKWEDNVSYYQKRLDELEGKKAAAIAELEQKPTRNFVSYNPDEMSIVNKFVADNNLPSADKFTDLSTDDGRTPRKLYMKNSDRTPGKLKLNPGKQKQRDMIGNVSGQRFKSKRAVHPILQEAADQAPEPTRESFAEIDRRAREMELDYDQIIEMNKGIDPAEAHAVGIALVRKGEKVERLAGAIARGEATDKQKTDFGEAFLEMASIYEAYSDIANNAGRLLASFRIAKQSSSNESLRFMREDAESAMGNPDGLEDVARKIVNKERSVGKSVKETSRTMDALANALNLPRTLMSSMDLSAALRQGVVFSATPRFWTSFIRMFQYMGSQRAFDALQHNIVNHPNYMKSREAGVNYTTTEGVNQVNLEEDFQSEWAKKIWVIGRGVKGSERAFVGFLNKLRFDTFNKYMKDFERASIDTNDPELLKGVGSFINAATGRGPIPEKYLGATPLLNGLFFSPRLNTSRIALLNPIYYGMLPSPVRKKAIKNMLGFAGLATTTLALASMGGADVELDPRSSDFGKIRVGTRRLDPLGGFGQFITFGSRIITGETKTIKGDIKTLEPGMASDSRLDVLVRFIRSKLAPVTSFVTDGLQGENMIGERFSVTEPFTSPPEGEEPVPFNKNAVISRLTPIYMQDVIEGMAEDGWESLPYLIPALFGVGYSDFDSVPSDSQLREENNPDSPVVKEITRLATVTDKNPFGNAGKRVNIAGDGEKSRTLTDEEYERYNTIADELILQDLEPVMADEVYQGLEEQDKVDLIKKVVKDARKDARGILAYELYGDNVEVLD